MSKDKKSDESDVKKTIIVVGGQDKTKDEFRKIGVIGEIEEEKCAELS